MESYTEFAIQHTERNVDDEADIRVVVSELMRPDDRECAEGALKEAQDVQANDPGLPCDAVIVSRTVEISDWLTHADIIRQLPIGTPVSYANPRTGETEPGWSYDGEDFRDGLVFLRRGGMGTGPLVTMEGVDPVNVSLVTPPAEPV